VVYTGGVAFDISGESGDEDTILRPEKMLKVSELEEWAGRKVAMLRFKVKGKEGWM
jgi:hypothetical protein